MSEKHVIKVISPLIQALDLSIPFTGVIFLFVLENPLFFEVWQEVYYKEIDLHLHVLRKTEKEVKEISLDLDSGRRKNLYENT